MKSKFFSFKVFVFLVITAGVMAACGGAETTAPEVVDESEAVEVVEEAEEPEPTAEPQLPEALILAGDFENGRIIYELGPEGVFEVYCSNCHTMDGHEDYAPNIKGSAERAANRVPGMSAEEYLYESIVDPEAYFVEAEWKGHPMPTTYGELYGDQDIADLIAFLMSQ